MENGGTVAFEIGIAPETVQQLNRMGHRLHESMNEFFGGYQAILLDPKTKFYHGASDPRRDGCAFGY